MRLDVATSLDPLAASVGEAKALGVTARGRDHRQMLRVDRRPADRRRDGGRAQRADATAKVSGQDLLELDESPNGGLLNPGDGRAGCGTEADRDRDRLVVVEEQRRHGGAGSKPVAAGRTAERLDRVSELAQPVDVATDRPPRYLEPVGELRPRPVAARLEERQELQESARGRGHGDLNHRRNRGQFLT